MITIIAGSRDITDYSLIEKACAECGWKITEVVSGCARGVDSLGEKWAMFHRVPVKRFPADWDTHGKAAGPIRNALMAGYAEALVAITNGSKGTAHMIETAKRNCLKVYVLNV